MNYRYSNNFRNNLKLSFNGLEKVEKNYSDLHQDMFVLGVLNGKENGTYLEIGSHDPISINNTFLLENVFNWKGVSIDIDNFFVNKFNNVRKNKSFLMNALEADYKKLLLDNNLTLIVDYLSCDCEPPLNTFKALQKIDHNEIKFRVITFEHDYYNTTEYRWVREESRNFLSDLGYTLVVSNISSMNNPIEDWWIHPDLVDMNRINNIIDTNSYNKNHQEYIYL
jgi:hypothetical protein